MTIPVVLQWVQVMIQLQLRSYLTLIVTFVLTLPILGPMTRPNMDTDIFHKCRRQSAILVSLY